MLIYADRRKTLGPAAGLLLLAIVIFMGGCGAPEPDTSAPQRVEVSRTDDWRGALLYIADEAGPTADWGSIRVYDNVSGFVEYTVEQTLAAGPGDVYVTPEGSTMFVASLSNGRIDQFHWNGNGWNHGSSTIDSPSSPLLTLAPGPDGMLYAADGATTSAGRFYVLDPNSGKLDTQGLSIPGLTGARGICWTADGRQAFVSGVGSNGPVLLKLSWPDAQVLAAADLPLPQPHQAVSSTDGALVFVMGQGAVLIVDARSLATVTTLQPSGAPDTTYYDGAFSADGRYLFTAGMEPGADSTLYVIDLNNNSVVQTVPHIGARANGIQRVE